MSNTITVHKLYCTNSCNISDTSQRMLSKDAARHGEKNDTKNQFSTRIEIRFFATGRQAYRLVNTRHIGFLHDHYPAEQSGRIIFYYPAYPVSSRILSGASLIGTHCTPWLRLCISITLNVFPNILKENGGWNNTWKINSNCIKKCSRSASWQPS